MYRRVLVESDVILDLLLERPPFHTAASRLFAAFQEGQLEGYVSSLAYADLFYLLRKPCGNSEAISILRKLRLATRVIAVDENVIDQALASSCSDFEDAVQYYAALGQGIEAIVTRNRRDDKPSQLAVIGPEECLGPEAP